jgi:hypothetical protein
MTGELCDNLPAMRASDDLCLAAIRAREFSGAFDIGYPSFAR